MTSAKVPSLPSSTSDHVGAGVQVAGPLGVLSPAISPVLGQFASQQSLGPQQSPSQQGNAPKLQPGPLLVPGAGRQTLTVRTWTASGGGQSRGGRGEEAAVWE